MMRGTCFALAALGAVLAPAPATAECPMATCGGNGTKMYGQHINGFNVAGQANVDGHRLVPDSVKLRPARPGSPCRYTGRPEALRLAVVKNQLVVYRPGGVPALGNVFVSDCLLGATFEVEIGRASGGGRTAIRIDRIAKTSTWHYDAPWTVEMYRFVAPRRALGGQSSICELKEGRLMEPWQVEGLTCDGDPPAGCRNPNAGEVQWHGKTDMAFVASGEVYADGDRGLKVIDGQVGADWFQIACAGSAMSKMVLMGLDLDDPVTRDVRFALMNMLAARYDGRHDTTETGWALQYQLVTGPTFRGWPQDAKIYKTEPEAYWGATGPVCLSHLRTWWKDAGRNKFKGTFADEPAHVASFGIPKCGTTAPAGALWKSNVVDHVTH